MLEPQYIFGFVVDVGISRLRCDTLAIVIYTFYVDVYIIDNILDTA